MSFAFSHSFSLKFFGLSHILAVLGLLHAKNSTCPTRHQQLLHFNLPKPLRTWKCKFFYSSLKLKQTEGQTQKISRNHRNSEGKRVLELVKWVIQNAQYLHHLSITGNSSLGNRCKTVVYLQNFSFHYEKSRSQDPKQSF